MATVTARSSDTSASKFVPIRPAFRPLLPKPVSNEHNNEPTVVVKSQRRITKKRKDQHSAITAAAISAAHAGSAKLPVTISPASLMAKRQRTPPGEESERRRSKLPSPELVPTVAASTTASTTVSTATIVPSLSLVDDGISFTAFSPVTSDTPGTPLSLFSHIDEQPSIVEEFADAGLDGVAGLNFDQFESDTYLAQAADTNGFEADFFTSNMDMFS